MKYEDLFIENNLPEPLSKDELYECFLKYKSGDIKAQEKIIKHNIRYVIKRVNDDFSNIDYDKKELVCIGIEGLIKAINTFDLEKNLTFLTYASTCIDNQIKTFLRKLKKYQKSLSLEQSVYTDQNGNEIYLIDTLEDERANFVSQYEKMEEIQIIKIIVENLDDKEKEMIKLHFGFYDRIYAQKEIAELMGISQSYVSKIITKTLLKIKNNYSKGLYDLYQVETNTNKVVKKTMKIHEK